MDEVQLILWILWCTLMPRGSQRFPEDPLRTYRTGASGHRWRPVRPSLPVRRPRRWSMALVGYVTAVEEQRWTLSGKLKWTVPKTFFWCVHVCSVCTCVHEKCRQETRTCLKLCCSLKLTAVQAPTWVCMCKNEIPSNVYQLIGHFIWKPVSKSVWLSVASISFWHGSEI